MGLCLETPLITNVNCELHTHALPLFAPQVFFRFGRPTEGHAPLLEAAACPESLWGELAAAAEPEWWGEGNAVLHACVQGAFMRACQQGRLLVVQGADAAAAGGAVMAAAAEAYQQLLLFATGLLTPGLEEVVVLAGANGWSDPAVRTPWVVLKVCSGGSLPPHWAALLLPPQPVDAVFHPLLAVHADWEALLGAEGATQLLHSACVCRGVPLPEQAHASLVRGAGVAALRLAARCPQQALPRLAGGTRVQWLVALQLVWANPFGLCWCWSAAVKHPAAAAMAAAAAHFMNAWHW